MNRIIAGADIGKKNIIFGVALFLILGVVAGIPLTVDFLGGSVLSAAQYHAWKVIHGYGVFLAFVNFYFGYCIDRPNMTRWQKEISSWSFVVAGLFGGIGRSALLLFSVQAAIGGYTASLIETLGFVLGTAIFVRGQIKESSANRFEQSAQAVSNPLS